MKFYSFILVVLCSTWAQSQQPKEQCLGKSASKNVNRDVKKILYQGQQEFSLNLLAAINKISPNENIFFSPYSTYHALLIAFFLAGNQTEQFLRNTLKLDNNQSKSDLHYTYKLDKLSTNFLTKDAEYEFTSANKIFVGDDIPVRDCIFDLFRDELELTKFRKNPEAARGLINSWVETRTHSMIKDLLPPGSVDETTDLVLVNAAYFKGMWLKKFNPSETKPDIFYVSPSKQIMVDMMHLEGTFNYAVSETLGAHILELPYKGEDISMFIFLPPFSKTNDALENTLSKLTLEEFKNIVDGNKLFSHTVKLSLPRFSLETTLELVPILESLGVGNLFQADADFSYLSNEKGISVDRGIHRAKLILNENGAEAAAATALIGWRIMDDEDDVKIVDFNCNRPFLFLLFNKQGNTIIFSGALRNPKN